MLRRVLGTAALVTVLTMAVQSARPLRAMDPAFPPAVLAAASSDAIPSAAYRLTRNDSLVVFGAHPDGRGGFGQLRIGVQVSLGGDSPRTR